MQTYKINIELNSPVAFIDRPTFDGILAYAWVREKTANKNLGQKLNLTKDELIDLSDMPIAMHENGYYIASSMFYDKENAVEFTERWRKRWGNKHDSLADFGKQKRKVRVNAGPYKSYDMPLRVVHVERVWFYFRTDKIEKVRELINKHIHFIGKKRSQGYGEISLVGFEKSDYNFSDIYRPIPARFLDISEYESLTIREHSWKPPYWLPEHIEPCAVP
jgi:hypothetical protein